ncbi:lytic polysaccharide monooxygenase [Streptosporangium sp. NPDC000396]|uniref:lytic polysaccharide monooxygenase auxiliary activity family 9 protein n=1 Tax=Streptosporangium sp. NPDC000396 TaxID=3366185 RepID=UPI0036780DD4
MNARRKAMATAVIAAPSVLLLTLIPGSAHAHGTMNNPPSRGLVCYTENPENPRSAACKQAVAMGGTQPLYDWNEVNIASAAGRHRELIPDGKLCSAGRDKYRGLDQARVDWPATSLPSGGKFTFTYRGTAPHRGMFELYVTKDGYDPSKPLKWSDLEAKPFLTQADPSMSNGSYVMNATLPAKKGRHLIYSIWQRSDSPEAFYSCSDVVFGGGTGTNPTPAPTPPSKPTATPKPTPTPTHGGGDHGGHGDPGDLSAISAGVGVSRRTVARAQTVTVTAVCSDSAVIQVYSSAFAKRSNYPPAGTVAWSPTLAVSANAPSGRYQVTVRCTNGSFARTPITVN